MIGDIANAIWQIEEAIAPSAGWDFERMLKVPDILVAQH